MDVLLDETDKSPTAIWYDFSFQKNGQNLEKFCKTDKGYSFALTHPR